MKSSHKNLLHLFTIRLLCFLMIFQGPPLLALDVLEIRAEPDFPQLPDAFGAPDWGLPRPGELPTWADVSLWAFPQGGGGGGASTQPPQIPDPASAARKSFDPESVTFKLWEKNVLDSIPVVPGWNLLSLPKTPPDASPSIVLDSLAGAYAKAWRYDACDPSDPWKLWNPADPSSDLTAFDTTHGFWLDGTSQADLAVEGDSPASVEIPICPGWNLIGFPAAQARPVPAALSSIDGKWLRVLAYQADHPVPSEWKIHSITRPDWANELKVMEPGRGYWVLATEAGTLKIANEGPAPAVGISIPQDLTVITEPTQVVGTASSELLSERRLEYREVGTADWLEAASGVAPVEDGPLGVFDPTLLINGLYELRVVASDFLGRTSESEPIAVSVEGNMKIGNFTLSFTDFSFPVSGLDIEIIRTYDSRLRMQSGDFGYGWTLDIRQGSYRNNRPPGEGWVISEGFLPCEVPQETKSHVTTIRLSDEEIYRFRVHLVDTVVGGGGCYGRAEFSFVDGILPGTTLEVLGNDQVFWENGTETLLDIDALAVFEPDAVRLTTRDGRIFDLDLEDGVTALEDLNGNRLTITPEGIEHSAGLGVVFERDDDGRIYQITDPIERSFTYFYDEAGDLERTVNQAEGETSFVYENHYLTETIDPENNPPTRIDYEDGRMVSITDALGHTMKFDHDIAGRREVITDRLDAVRVLEYDERGNVVREINALEQEILRTYDDKGRLLTQTDPLENTTTWVYDDLGDLVELRDALEQVETWTYNDRGQILTKTNQEESTTVTYRYDPNGNLKEVENELKQVTKMEYDDAGNRTRIIDPFENTTLQDYDDYGRVISTTDPLGNTVTHKYDLVGHQTKDTRVVETPDGLVEISQTYEWTPLSRPKKLEQENGTIRNTIYNALGDPTEVYDNLGHRIVLDYDPLGNTKQVNFSNGTKIVNKYDAEGRLTSRITPEEEEIIFKYDVLGRKSMTLYGDETSELYEYDAGGRLEKLTDRRGRVTLFEYDELGREKKKTLVDETLAVENVIISEWDSEDRLRSVTDELGTTRYEYDLAGRQAAIVYPDLSREETDYDEAGRLAEKRDKNQRPTKYRYDSRGRLIETIDPLLQPTTAVYDGQGGMTITDAKRQVTKLQYSVSGHLLSRVLPNQNRESKTYDDRGRILTAQDFNGVVSTYGHDAEGRMTSLTMPDDSDVSYTYTENGLRKTMTDARGVTTYAYDGDLLTLVEHPDGSALGYDYDEHNRRSEMRLLLPGKDPQITKYDYDSFDRLILVTDPQEGEYVIDYDFGGRPDKVTYPNGVETHRKWDEMNRVSEVTTQKSDGTILDRFVVARDIAGRPTEIARHNGTVREYDYDDLDRLIRETVLNAEEEIIFEDRFFYDEVGNRERRERLSEGSSEPEITVYEYDEANRLIAVDGAPYHWDKNGNLVEIEGAATYSWDHRDRLIGVDLEDGRSVRYRYDGDGVLVERDEYLGGELVESKQFVNDTTGLSQVVAEIDVGDSSQIHVLGSMPLALLGQNSAEYLHPDWGGSIAQKTGQDGVTLEDFSYSAFGEPNSSGETSLDGRLYRGEIFDEASGLYYLRARWMEPVSGRFLSLDPLKGYLENPVSRHGYAYADLNPMTKTDPTGLSTTSNLVVGLAATALIGIASNFYVRTLSIKVPTIARFAYANIGPWDDERILDQIISTESIYINEVATWPVFLAADYPSLEERDRAKSSRLDRYSAAGLASAWWPQSSIISGNAMVLFTDLYKGEETIYGYTEEFSNGVYPGVTVSARAMDFSTTTAHEIVHAVISLGGPAHNNDPDNLMCGGSEAESAGITCSPTADELSFSQRATIKCGISYYNMHSNPEDKCFLGALDRFTKWQAKP